MVDEPDEERGRPPIEREEPSSGELDQHPNHPLEGVSCILVAAFFALVFGAIALAVKGAFEAGWP